MSLKKCQSKLEETLNRYLDKRQALLPCLHIAQEECGYVAEEVISFLAQKLGLPNVEVYTVVTFYSMFSLEERGKFVIRVCVSLPCYLNGSRRILEAIEKELNIKAGQTTPDKKFTIEPVSCLGLCDMTPAIMVNEKIYGNLTPRQVKNIIKKHKESKRR